MKKPVSLLLLFLTLTVARAHATTWNEPWVDKVIRSSTSFVLAKVISSDPEKGVKISVIRALGGKTLKDSLVITGFSLLEICSISGEHGPEFRIAEADSCFFFISQAKDGKYCIATPTTGFDYVRDGKVRASYRHSYHQALVPFEVYEKTMTAVFNHYHGLPFDKDYLSKFVSEQLSKAPAGFGEEEISTFFLQHVAMECVYHLRLKVDENLLLPFLNDPENSHNNISAARALAAANTGTSKQALLKIINDPKQTTFLQVICIWSLAEYQPAELKDQLQKAVASASEESNDFGGNIMDPRVCTSIPSVKEALHTLVVKL
ncbi:hypothetical protein [Chitinophaga sp. YIM B06452]|uniref:hypothetical protein n=1 Tax=Chitinophaga sp. YIM B06452 TaxID=3082158 RepID=UPI0031FE4F24